MKRIGLLFLMTVLLSMAGWANNIRIKGDVKVNPDDVDISTGVATIRFTVQWDNSWRDAFNHDGVYLFFKYKVDGESEKWHHAYMMSSGCAPKTSGYEITMVNSSGGKDKCEGLFLYRAEKGFGNPEVEMELKWLITSNSDRKLTRDDFVAGNVFLSAMGIEMVYVPRGAFRIGDTKSENTFKYNDVTLPAELDVLTDKKFVYTSSCQTDASTKGSNPPEFAVNHVNSPGTTSVNAWVGCTKTGDAKDYWMVDFGEGNGKQIFNLAIESIPGGTPTEWTLEGMNSGTWTELYRGQGTDWAINSSRTYPCTHAIEIPKTSTAYRYYRINILSTNQPVVIKNIAMTEKQNLFNKVDNSVLIYKPQTEMSDRRGLYAADGDNWSGITPVTYPNGYPAFWAMKYEISQEQYVTFLNKLGEEQQRTRTVGGELERLKEGDYVFGTYKTKPAARNGIKLASIGVNGQPHVFVNDLDAGNDYAQDGDGQTLACNFLNAGDMLAYADWCGLRPLSEMEFEKMARRPFPEAAVWNEYAWNSNTDFNSSSGLVTLTKGTKSEKPLNGNVNAEGKIGGPIRCGAYAAMGGRQVASGSSFWGLMELSGNLDEIYYNVNTEGRLFCANQEVHHGNGKLADGGATDISPAIWPMHERAFALRGGSFKSPKAQAAISDRSRHWGIYPSVNAVSVQRDSTVTFRLGRTAKVMSTKSEITLQNGLSSAHTDPVDTVCSGSDYVIKGTIPNVIDGAYRVAWFVSEDKGKSWDLIPGQEEPTLKLKNLQNLNEATNFFKEYQYDRRILSNGSDVMQTRPVKIRVVDHQVSISRYKDTVDIYNHSGGIEVTSKQAATFKWYWLRPNSGNRELTVEYPDLSPNISQLNFLKYSDFENIAEGASEDVRVLIETQVLRTCVKRDTIKVHVVKQPKIVNNVLGDGAVNPDFTCGDIFVDNENIGGNKRYTTVKLGNDCWMAQNLNRSTTNGIGASRCYGGVEANCDTYGRLYNFHAVTQTSTPTINLGADHQGICPKGWHMPTNQEWLDMITAVKGSTANVEQNDAKSLKSSLNEWSGNDKNIVGNNSSRFSALPNGGRFYTYSTSYPSFWGNARNGDYDLNNLSWWWTSTVEARHWSTYSGGYNVAAIPYHVTLDNTSNIIYNNTVVGWGNNGYLKWSVLSGSDYRYLYSNVYGNTDYQSGYNATVTSYIWTNYYFGVRCVKD